MKTALSAVAKAALDLACNGYATLVACNGIGDDVKVEDRQKKGQLESGDIILANELLVYEPSCVASTDMRWWLDVDKFVDLIHNDARSKDAADVVLCLAERDVGLNAALDESGESMNEEVVLAIMDELRYLIK